MIKVCTYMWHKNAKKKKENPKQTKKQEEKETQIHLKINWFLFSEPIIQKVQRKAS